ncbi:hypothetical protein [Agrobacterium vitis]|uniref:hypothetical protein n=1 Tax=Agrobacterium vitis TaxID=373 RepID=UPI0012E820CC|nr:hypothetical protein [Agrobacterium vitis]MVA62896.1 hypothetical protein [Agrobacterium vitis]
MMAQRFSAFDKTQYTEAWRIARSAGKVGASSPWVYASMIRCRIEGQFDSIDRPAATAA